jgi:hypothetical protein
MKAKALTVAEQQARRERARAVIASWNAELASGDLPLWSPSLRAKLRMIPQQAVAPVRAPPGAAARQSGRAFRRGRLRIRRSSACGYMFAERHQLG